MKLKEFRQILDAIIDKGWSTFNEATLEWEDITQELRETFRDKKVLRDFFDYCKLASSRSGISIHDTAYSALGKGIYEMYL